jgi:hypothetical protein
MDPFYEILLRGRPDGTLAGGHIIPFVAGNPGTAAPIGTARSVIAWPDVVDSVNAASIATIETLTAQVASMEASMEASVAEADSLRAQLAAAQAQIDTLTAPPEPEPITAITPRQLRLYLLSIDRLAEVESIVASLPGADGHAARIEWEYSQEVRRAHPLTAAIGQILGLDSDALDAAFSAAAAL